MALISIIQTVPSDGNFAFSAMRRLTEPLAKGKYQEDCRHELGLCNCYARSVWHLTRMAQWIQWNTNTSYFSILGRCAAALHPSPPSWLMFRCPVSHNADNHLVGCGTASVSPGLGGTRHKHRSPGNPHFTAALSAASLPLLFTFFILQSTYKVSLWIQNL